MPDLQSSDERGAPMSQRHRAASVLLPSSPRFVLGVCDAVWRLVAQPMASAPGGFPFACRPWPRGDGGPPLLPAARRVVLAGCANQSKLFRKKALASLIGKRPCALTSCECVVPRWLARSSPRACLLIIESLGGRAFASMCSRRTLCRRSRGARYVALAWTWATPRQRPSPWAD